MKKVLVTGGLGFIGSNWIVQNHKDYEIFNVDAGYTGSNFDNLPVILTKVTTLMKDICDLKVEDLDGFVPDYVINFAAESHVDRSITDPLSFVKTNVLGTANMLELVRQNFKTARFLHVSTDEVFGQLGKDDMAFNEKTPYNPRSPYSASKASSDHLVRAYRSTYGMDVIITNCCNNYGPRQYPEKLIPVVIKKCLSGESIPVYGKGDNIREWLHVDDHNRAITRALESGKSGQTYCIGSNDEVSNIDLVKKICTVLDELRPKTTKYEEQISFVEDRAGHDFRYAILWQKANYQLKWEPQVEFDKGLKDTIKWYLDN